MPKLPFKYTIGWDPSNSLRILCVIYLGSFSPLTLSPISKSKPVQWNWPITQKSQVVWHISGVHSVIKKKKRQKKEEIFGHGDSI